MDPFDPIAYPSGAFPRTHPTHLAAVARLFAIDAPDPTRCRVLEIGCCDAANLLPMAAALPGATFVGIDPAQRPIAVGEARRREADLDNVRLHAVGVEGIDASWGAFDYVICHGVWSWVGPEAREAILAVCGRHLAPNGVAYVSYNTLPGWYPLMAARDLMRRHAAGFEDPRERVEQARAVVELLREGAGPRRASYGLAAREVAASLADKPDGYLHHEYLMAHHEPTYFSEFIASAASAGLRYLAEAELSSMFDRDLPEAGRQGLALLGRDLIAREQLLDFLRGQSFRATLLVRQETPIERRWSPDRLDGLWLRSHLRRAADGQLRQDGREAPFDGAPPAVLQRLVDASPDALSARAAVADPGEASQVLELVSRGLIEVRAAAPGWTLRPGLRPTATRLARVQAREGDEVVALDHRRVKLTAAQRALVRNADGRGGHPRRLVDALARGCLWPVST